MQERKNKQTNKQKGIWVMPAIIYLTEKPLHILMMQVSSHG